MSYSNSVYLENSQNIRPFTANHVFVASSFIYQISDKNIPTCLQISIQTKVDDSIVCILFAEQSTLG